LKSFESYWKLEFGSGVLTSYCNPVVIMKCVYYIGHKEIFYQCTFTKRSLGTKLRLRKKVAWLPQTFFSCAKYKHRILHRMFPPLSRKIISDENLKQKKLTHWNLATINLLRKVVCFVLSCWDFQTCSLYFQKVLDG
jgi:hypothetical protein